jgi:tetratricopeptide (TPR) repeat protein
MSPTLRILHISDLHATPGPDAWRLQRVLGDAWKRNLDDLLEDGPFDLVCFTGDVVHAGKATEYAFAHALVAQLLEPLRLPMERLFVVPGNHDIDRDVGKAAWEALRENHGRTGPVELARWMAGGKPPLGYEPEHRDQLLARQAAYRDWVGQQLKRPELLPESSPHGALGYRSTFRLSHLPFELHVIGLDSAWAAGDNHDSGKLLLTDAQVGRLTMGADGKALPGFRLALIHHPLTELFDGRHLSRLLADNVDLLLRGHLHDTAVEALMEPGRTSRQLAAGCLYESDRWPNACHAITVHFDEHGRPERYALRFRAWSPRGHWFDDGGVYGKARGGQLSWPPAPALQDTRPPPPVFIGREEELRKIAAHVLPEDGRDPIPVTLQGMAGIGKTTLAERFFERHGKEHFPGGLLRVVLDPQAPQRADQLLQQLAERLELPVGLEGLAERVRERVNGTRMLVLVENVDSDPAAAVSVALVRQLSGCPLLLTGRLLGLGADAGWKFIEVPLFGETQALEQLDAEWKPAQPHEVAQRKELARELGYLPLALHLAAGYLRTGGYDVPSFLGELRAQKLKLTPLDPADRLLDGTHDSARAVLASTFELSLKLLRGKLGAEEEQMAALGALGHAPASGFGARLGAAVAGLPERELRRLVLHALQLSLLSQVPRAEGAWRIHPLVAEFLRHQPGAADGFARLGEWFLSRLPKLGLGQEQEQGQRWKEIHQEAEALVDWLARVPKEDFFRVERAGTMYARINGPYAAWMAFCERALKSSLSDKARSSLLWTLCQVAYRGGALDRALSAAEEKLRLDRERKDERSAALASGLQADILEMRGQLDEALRIRREESLPVFEKLGDVRERAIIQGRIADILEARGQHEESLRIRREESLLVFEKLGDVRSKAIVQGRIADILEARGQYEEALRIRREEELPVYEKLGDVHSLAITQEKIAGILRARGQHEEALRILREEVVPAVERLGDVYLLCVVRANLAMLYLSRGKEGDRQQAIDLLHLALEKAEEMRIPETGQIRAILKQYGLPPR